MCALGPVYIGVYMYIYVLLQLVRIEEAVLSTHPISNSGHTRRMGLPCIGVVGVYT